MTDPPEKQEPQAGENTRLCYKCAKAIGNNDTYRGNGLCESCTDMPELTPANLKAIFHLALRACDGLAIPQKVLDEYPEDAPVIMRYDETNKVLNVFVPKKRPKRGKIKKTVSNRIIQPSRELLVPIEL